MSEARIELRGGPASYTNLTVYRDNSHQLPLTVEVIVGGGVLDYKLTGSVTWNGNPNTDWVVVISVLKLLTRL